MSIFNLDDYISNTEDFPRKGVLFKDISPLLQNHKAMSRVIDIFTSKALDLHADLIVGIESRGFLFSTLLASKLKIGSAMIRKPGKLPGNLIEKEYSLEYGNSSLSIQKSKDIANKRVIIIDDLIATGGTLACAESLLTEASAKVISCFALIELSELNGSNLVNSDIFSIKKY
jgi:adenine phosphoribosyltransferase|tara:strand:- start:362 stop:880 length:519 start_codon:yes stop_codon:yes gene_type:complete